MRLCAAGSAIPNLHQCRLNTDIVMPTPFYPYLIKRQIYLPLVYSMVSAVIGCALERNILAAKLADPMILGCARRIE
jgi:hypothetical protein